MVIDMSKRMNYLSEIQKKSKGALLLTHNFTKVMESPLRSRAIGPAEVSFNLQSGAPSASKGCAEKRGALLGMAKLIVRG